MSVKIRIFEDLDKTLSYARALEAAGASLVAVHGRTREQKDASAVRASWDAIAAVKAALTVPVLGNGDVRCLADAERMMSETGVDGVLSAEPLLCDPALFAPRRLAEEPPGHLTCFGLAREYLDLATEHSVPVRMIRVCSPTARHVPGLIDLSVAWQPTCMPRSVPPFHSLSTAIAHCAAAAAGAASSDLHRCAAGPHAQVPWRLVPGAHGRARRIHW